MRALDAQGRAVPLADAQVTFAVTGGGRSIGHGNGDPNSHEDEKGATRRLFNGLAQLIVQTNYDGTEAISVTATAPGLAPARISIPVKTTPARPYVAAAVNLAAMAVASIALPRPRDESSGAGGGN